MKKYLLTLGMVWYLLGCAVYTPPKTYPSPSPAPAPAPVVMSAHLKLGNPTNASGDLSSPTNYLMIKPQYTLSYNREKGHPNWVSWELSKEWLGESDRQNDFRPDPSLPSSWYQVRPSDYTGSGFDRGHLCPSADRTKNAEDNSNTFYMTNMIPQAPELNREAWAYLEEYTREIVKKGYKAYVVAGAYGTGGEGSNGNAASLNNKVNVPARVYKVAVFYPENGNIDENSIVIATDFPNKVSLTKEVSWLRYVTTADAIEKSTSVRFFSNLPTSVQQVLKTRRFDYLNTSLEVEAAIRTYKGNPLYVGKKGGCYYFNSSGKKTYVDHSLCGIE
ncbi:MAG: DNA/RNA non-specific endonuclease [Spirosomataceae bacterium]